MVKTVLVALIFTFGVSETSAKTHDRRAANLSRVGVALLPPTSVDMIADMSARRHTRHGRRYAGKRSLRHHARGRSVIMADRGARDANGNSAARTVIGSKPPDCPLRWCGCGLARYLGLPNIGGRLNLAKAWLSVFPTTPPAPGAVAARSGHVMLLVKQISGNIWRVADFNSGPRLRDGVRGALVHDRSVRGFGFVRPPVQAGDVMANL